VTLETLRDRAVAARVRVVGVAACIANLWARGEEPTDSTKDDLSRALAALEEAEDDLSRALEAK
jgi:hypothetical protein